MTVDEPVHIPGSFLIDGVPPIFYNAPIPYKHWQLRSLLCSPSPNVLYYPNDSRIYSLNTFTREQSLVANLHFEPRCIGAKYGWVCAGGVEHGQFAAIHVSSTDSGASSKAVTRKSSRECLGDARAVDEFEDLSEYMVETRPGRLAKYVRLTEMGGTIVNSITLHRPLDAKGDDDIVAVVTNNDKTVRIFSLSKFQLLTTLYLPFHTNHASISPDGQHLVVVGDSPKVYFYRPSHLHLHSNKDKKATYIGWTLCSDLPLTTGSEALISTHFSPSSALCSVASQDGSVTVFDIQRLMHEEIYGYDDRYPPIIEVIPSSRPRSQVGAVRSVQFSPEPWDLLIWAEHTGRVSITDIRTGFCRRQIINVVATGDSILEKTISRAGGEEEALCDYDPPPRETPASDYDLPDLISGSVFIQRSSTHGPNLAALEPTTSADGPISDDEDSYITSMRSFLNTRRQLDELIHAIPGTTHVATTTSTEWPTLASAWRSNSSTSALTSTTFTPTSAAFTPTSATFTPTSASTGHIRPIPTLPTHLDYTDQLDRLNRQNRRRLELAASGSSSSSVASSPVPDNQTPEERYRRARERLARLEYIRRAHLTQNTLPAWSGVASGAGSGSSSRRPLYMPAAAAAAAAASASGSGRRNRSSGDELDITGCTISCDGQKLYVATTAGILEYAIDLTARRVFPRVQPR